MSSIEGIDKIGEQAARIDIQGPGEDGMRVSKEVLGPEQTSSFLNDGREPDELEERLANDLDGVNAVRIDGPNGTRGAEAVRTVVAHVLSDGEVVDSGGELFDGAAYVAVPEIDGQTTDKLVIAFSGSVAYDATDDAGAKMFNDLALGKAVELRVAGYVANKQGGYKVTATEEVVTGKAVIKVDTLYLLTPERLTD